MRIGDSLRPSADQTHQPRSVPQECHRGSLPHSPRLQEAAPLPHLGGRVSRGSGAAAFPPHPAERMLFCLQTPSPSHAQTFVTVAALEDPTLLHSGSVSAVSSLITTSLKPDQMRPWPPTQPAPPASAIITCRLPEVPDQAPTNAGARREQKCFLPDWLTLCTQPGAVPTPSVLRTAPGCPGSASISDRGSSPGSHSSLVAGAWGLSGPLPMEGTQEPLTLCIPSPHRPASGQEPEEAGGAGHAWLLGCPPMPLPLQRVSRE